MKDYKKLGIDNVEMDYRELRGIVNRTHDRFSEINFDQSLSLLQKVNLLAEHFKIVLKDFQVVVDYLDDFIDKFDENLYKTVDDILNKWLQDGVIDGLVKELLEEYLSKSRNSIHGSRILSLTEYPRKINEISDEFRIQRMIDEAKPYDILEFSDGIKLYLNKTTIVIDKPLTILGYDCELITECDCTTYTMKVINTTDVYIERIKFDQNLRGRNSLWFENVGRVAVHKCEFTGYTAEFGNYKTDSAIMLYNSEYAKVTDCYFHDHGYQYGTATETLNRCITHQGTSKKAIITGCIFERVNQAIVSDTGVLISNNCIFEYTKDNDYYLLGGTAIITDCYMNDYHDECIVMGNMDHVTISNITAKNVPNKFIALTNNCKDVILSNINVLNDEVESGQCITWRKKDITIDNLSISNLSFSNTAYKYNYPFIEMFNVLNLTVENIDIQVHMERDQNVVKIGSSKGEISGFVFKQLSGGGSGGINIDDGSLIKLSGISLSGARINKTNTISTIGGYLQTNTGNAYYTRESGRSIFYVDNIPQSQNESKTRWVEGDIAINILLDPNNATNTNQMMWLFTGNEWRVLARSTDHRGGTFSPIGKATPYFLGEIFIRTDLEEIYVAVGISDKNKWKKIG